MKSNEKNAIIEWMMYYLLFLYFKYLFILKAKSSQVLNLFGIDNDSLLTIEIIEASDLLYDEDG